LLVGLFSTAKVDNVTFERFDMFLQTLMKITID